MAHRFTEAELGVFEETFSHFDTDSDGLISIEELGTVMRSLEHILIHLRETFTDKKLDEMIKAVDADGDGKVSYEEFVRLMAEK
ncbi:hypothetical protein lerEdw1_003856 [Lerista edwardsae]|nr:hypothetical protein lerEdw1_003856 [Lerista edwardsae]